MTHKDVFILGAGFSNAINSQMPTMKELTAAVSERIEGSELCLPPPLKDTKGNGGELESNIELWMTYLSQRQPWLHESFNQYNQALATRIRRYIREVVDQTSFNSMTTSKPEWLGSLIEQWSKRQSSVITLNYDTLVERAAGALVVPEINNGRGIALSQMYPPYFSDIRSRVTMLLGAGPLDTFKYFKLHGSINWHYSGREDFYGETIFYSDVSPWGPKNSHEKLSSSSAMDKETLIIPPVSEKTTYFNNETVRRLWQEGSEALEGATRVFVIGYSLPISDLGMRFFLKRSLPITGTPWYIVDLDRDITGLYQDLLGPQQTISGQFVGEEDVVRNFVESYISLP